MLGMRILVDFLATSASDIHPRSMLSMLHKLGPALNQVNNELRKISPILPQVKDELRQIGPILPQLMAQIRKSARQQQRFEVALLDLHSELQHLKTIPALRG